MLQALFYKEWIKSRRLVLLISIIFVGIVIYTFINIGQAFRVDGAVQVWGGIILKDASIFPSILQWLPVLVAVALSFAQFVPEISSKKLKLTLHLPMAETKIVSAMLYYGLCVLLAIYLLTYIALMLGLSFYFPHEIRIMAFWASLPWFAAGIVGYLLGAWVCLEPVLRQRICNGIISVCILSLFFIRAQSGSHLPLLPFLLIILIIAYGAPFYSAARFKEGKQ